MLQVCLQKLDSLVKSIYSRWQRLKIFLLIFVNRRWNIYYAVWITHRAHISNFFIVYRWNFLLRGLFLYDTWLSFILLVAVVLDTGSVMNLAWFRDWNRRYGYILARGCFDQWPRVKQFFILKTLTFYWFLSVCNIVNLTTIRSFADSA